MGFDLEQKEAESNELEAKGLAVNKFLFMVKNLKQHEDKAKFCPVPGGSIDGFLGGTHEIHFLGLNNKALAPQLVKLEHVNAGKLDLDEFLDGLEPYEEEKLKPTRVKPLVGVRKKPKEAVKPKENVQEVKPKGGK